ncbi:type II toxin-antitoxin system VapC family toxin [Trichothermofontia sichuanensis B231]|uniref:type II toxin-antitoxin system VapC family toxin n=1 Tax=Trichothermofontia sichuanensis TaxID=3045816 RepID=UPI0022464E78|nr:type II toxin-antitoxin system VapC family toxin [Trichothermofontia sichuanensis]UZQ53334.1 type II toxin-antitoxin system VapC family toxin [Trichothermofontia sichuanensis B231]
MSSVVLDASAMLAYLFDEEGAGLVETALNDSACIGAINWSEVLSKVEDKGHSSEALIITLTNQGLLGNTLEVLSTTEKDALLIAQLQPQTKLLGLSLGDRACLALGMRLEIPVLTADTAWNDLTLNISIRMIR